MQMERRSMRWFAAAMAVVYLSACGGGGGDGPSSGGGSRGDASGSPSPGPSPSPAPGGSPPPPPAGTPPAAPPPGSGTAPIPDPGAPPAVPFTLTITSVPQRGLKLAWPAVAGAAGYRVQRDDDATDGVDNFANVNDPFVPAPAVSRTLTDLRLVDAIDHKYRVLAIPAGGGAPLATATERVNGDLAASITTQVDAAPLDDSLDNASRAMATAMRGTRHVLAVGQPGANQGTGLVRIYERSTDGGAWTKVQTLSKQSSPALKDHFGASLSLSPNGQYLAVGIPGDRRATQGTGINPELNAGMADVEDSGAVEVYQYSGTAWVKRAWFKAINAGPGDAFGTAVAISDEGHLIVGAPNEDSPASAGLFLPTSADAPELRDDPDNAMDRGAVYTYVNGASGYSFGGYVKPPTTGGGTSLYFGAAIAIDALARRVAVGAPRASYNGTHAGGVAIYDLNWTQAPAPLPPSVISIWGLRAAFGPGGDRASTVGANPGASSAAYRGLGGSLSMSQDGNWLAAGYADKGGMVAETGVSLPPNAGEVILYRNQGGPWAPHSWPTAPVPVGGDRFGISVSLVNGDNGLQLLVGTYGDGSGHKGLTRAADIVPEGFVATRDSGAAYCFAGRADPSQPLLLKARLKSPDPITDQFLGQATAITRDGNELLLTGEYKGDSSKPAGQAIFFGY